MKKLFSDRTLIYCCSFLRSISFGMISVILAIYLMQLNITKIQVGLIVSTGLIGAALGNIFATLLGNRFGRRKILIGYALLSCAGAVALGLSTNFYSLLVVAFFSMLNARGKDRGTAVILETAMMPSLDKQENRTKAFAWYAIVQDVGLAIGGIVAGLPTLLKSLWDVPQFMSFQSLLGFYAVSMAITAIIYSRLSSKVEAPCHTIKSSCTPEGRKRIFKISSLFALDSLGSGFLTSALIAYYLYERFGIGVETIGILFFLGRCINALSYFVAVPLSKKLGLLRTMILSHMPSHFLLIAMAFAPTFPVVVAIFLIREFLVEMDVPTRQSYVMAVVKPEDRTFAAGITQVVRMAGWAIGPAFAGLVMHYFHSAAPLFVGAAMKFSYDMLLYFSFRKVKPPEEKAALAAVA